MGDVDEKKRANLSINGLYVMHVITNREHLTENLIEGPKYTFDKRQGVKMHVLIKYKGIKCILP